MTKFKQIALEAAVEINKVIHREIEGDSLPGAYTAIILAAIERALANSTEFWKSVASAQKPGAAGSEPKEWTGEHIRTWMGNEQSLADAINSALAAEREAYEEAKQIACGWYDKLKAERSEREIIERSRDAWKSQVAGLTEALAAEREEAERVAQTLYRNIKESQQELASEQQRWADQSNKLYKMIQDRDKELAAEQKKCDNLWKLVCKYRATAKAERERSDKGWTVAKGYLDKLLAAQVAIAEHNTASRPFYEIKADLSALEQHDKELIDSARLEQARDDRKHYDALRKPLVEALDVLELLKTREPKLPKDVVALIDAALASVKEGK